MWLGAALFPGGAGGAGGAAPAHVPVLEQGPRPPALLRPDPGVSGP